MKPLKLNEITAAILLASWMVPIASAETLIFTGNSAIDPQLRNIIFPVAPAVANSLAPNELSNNMVTVSGGTIGGNVFGGVHQLATPAVLQDVMGNMVAVSGGSIGGDLFGGATVAGDVTGNQVDITGGTIAGRVFGGRTQSGEAAENTVTIAPTTGSIDLVAVIGGWAAAMDDRAAQNEVTLNRGANIVVNNNSEGRAVGGWSEGDASLNRLTINEGARVDITLTANAGTDRIVGGYAREGNATNNTLAITGGSASLLLIDPADADATAQPSPLAPIAGGWGRLSANQNSLTISGNSAVTGFSAGGASDGTALGNLVTVTGGTISTNRGAAADPNQTALAGGFNNGQLLTDLLSPSTVSFNTVDLSGMTNVTGKVHGGLSLGATIVENNTLSVNLAETGAGINGDVYGGTFEGMASRITPIDGLRINTNTLELNAGSVNGDAFGGKILSQGVGVSNSTVSENFVTLDGARVTGSVYGGYVTHAGTADTGAVVTGLNVTNNAVMLTGGEVIRPANPTTPQPFPGSIYGGNITTPGMAIRNSTISGNSVLVDGGTITSGNAYAGFVQSGVGISNTALTGNMAQVDSGTVNGNVYGSFALLTGGTATNLNVTGNTTTINGGSVLQGPSPLPDGVTRAQAPLGVYGGKIISVGTAAINNSNISGNTVMINSGATIGAEGAPVNVYGGFLSSRAAPTNVSITNNTVHLAEGSTVYGNIRGGFVEAGTPGREGVNISNNTLVVAGRVNGQIGSITGFDNYDFRLNTTALNGAPILSTTETVDLAGANIALSITGGNGALGAQGESLELFNRTTGLPEGEMIAVRGITFLDSYTLTTGADGSLRAVLGETVVNTQANNVTGGYSASLVGAMQANAFAVDQGLDAFMNTAIQPGQWAPFIAAGTGSNNYNGLDTRQTSSLLGIGTAVALADGIWHIAAFGETGRQSYQTSAFNVTGAGDSRYGGGGLMTRFTLNNGFYGDLTLRTGSSRFDYRSNSFGALDASYNLRSNYRGAAVTAGIISDFGSGLVLDSHLRYLYTRQDGATATVAGDTVRFGRANIGTGRLGFDLAYRPGSGWTPYASVALERTFNSDNNTTSQGVRLESLDLSGNTFIGGVGVRFNPTTNWSVDANLSGHTGVRDGYQANVGLSYGF